jgi:ribonuclease P protein component
MIRDDLSGRKSGAARQADGEKQPGQGLSRTQRLTRSTDFEETFQNGSRFPGHFMVLWLRHGPDAALRLGVVTAKRVYRRSVDRVRARRRLREVYRRNRSRFTGSYDVILTARHPINAARFADVEAELLKLARRAGLTSGRQPQSPDAPAKSDAPPAGEVCAGQ